MDTLYIKLLLIRQVSKVSTLLKSQLLSTRGRTPCDILSAYQTKYSLNNPLQKNLINLINYHCMSFAYKKKFCNDVKIMQRGSWYGFSFFGIMFATIIRKNIRKLGRHCFSVSWEQYRRISGKAVVQVTRTVMCLQQNYYIKAVVTKFDCQMNLRKYIF